MTPAGKVGAMAQRGGFAGKRCLTGAASGIGRAMALSSPPRR